MQRNLWMGCAIVALVEFGCADSEPVDRAAGSGEVGIKADDSADLAQMSPSGELARRARETLRALGKPTGGVFGPGIPPDVVDDLNLPGGSQGELSIETDDTGQFVVVGFNDFRGFNLEVTSVSGFMWSDDFGRTYHDGGQLPTDIIPGAANTFFPPFVFGDPDVKFIPGSGCTFIYSSILVIFDEEGRGTQTMGFHRSTDCGQTWVGPYEIPPATNPNGQIDPDGFAVDAADKEFIGVDPDSARVMMSWSNFTADDIEISTTFSDDILAEIPTWSDRQVVEEGGSVQSSIPRFGPPGTDLAYVAYRKGLDDGTVTISFARSTNNGASWSAPMEIAPGAFPPDHILGNDRINNSPSMAVDQSFGRHRGNIYIVHVQNDLQDGGDVVVQRSTNRGRSFSPALILNARPGEDRSQWFPVVTVDNKSGRVFVFYYDQGVADSGDETQTTWLYSDNGGRTWSQPRELSPRPYHAGWGNTTGQPNLGDYNQGVINAQHELLAAYAITSLPAWTDGQATGQFSVPEPIVSIKGLLDQFPVTSVDFRGTQVREIAGFADVNGFLDPGELFLASISVRNYDTNPIHARAITSPIPSLDLAAVAFVESPTPGVQILFGVTSFGNLAPGATRQGTVPFLIKLADSFVAGTDVELVIHVLSLNGLPAVLHATLHTGTPVKTLLVAQDFNAGAAGWVTAHGAGQNVVPWTITDTFCGTTSPAAFHANADDGPPGGTPSRWERLFSPTFVVPADSEYVEVEFDVCYDTEDDPAFNVLAYDGFFLRIFDATPGIAVARSNLAEAFAAEITTNGFFHYPKHFPRNNDPFYFQDMSVWAGDSGGIQHVRMRLPGMAGATAQLRFEFAQDGSFTCADIRPGHTCGVLLDNVIVNSVNSAD